MDLCQQSDVSSQHTVTAFLPRNKRLLISRLQSPSAVILEPRKRKSITTPTFSPSICHEVMGPEGMTSIFSTFSFKPAASLFSFALERLQFPFTFCRWSGIIRISEVAGVFPPILIPACSSSSPAFLMMCSAHRLSKQGDRRQPCRTPFSILNQSVVPYRVLIVAS